MLRTVEREINGARYESTTLPARITLALGTRIAKLIAPSIGALGASISDIRQAVQDGDGDRVLSGGILARAADALVTQLDKEDVVDLVLRLLASTVRVDPASKTRQEVGKGEVFDSVYAGEITEMIQAIKFALEVNLANFSIGGRIGGLWERAKRLEESMMSEGSSSEARTTT